MPLLWIIDSPVSRTVRNIFFLNKVGSLGFSVIAVQNKKEISLKPFSYSHFDICRCLLDTIN